MRNPLFLGLAIAFLIGAAPAAPQAPMQQAPGYFRFPVGDFMVTALQDGVINLNPKGLQGIAPDQVQKLYAAAYLLKPEGVPTSVNAYLVDTGAHRILVDGGNADCYSWKLDGIAVNLRAAGYKPEDIDTIVLTHLHGDHVCGLATADGKPAYPNATVWAAEDEAKYWFDEKLAASLPEGLRPTLAKIRGALQSYGAAFHTFKPGDAIVPGVRIVPAPGHTPGHTAFMFESKGAAFLAFGDIVHFYTIQFPHPQASVGSDSNAKQAVSTRRALFAAAAKDGTVVAGSHLPFPGIGHIRKQGNGYVWVPVEFAPLAK
jgi:glyoxylase-like metal-dependent hydrolase (beta-lactamase superfamily II)